MLVASICSFVCRCCLRGVRRFSFWFNNLGLITDRNTYRRYAASALPLWGNTDVVLADRSFSGAIVRERSKGISGAVSGEVFAQVKIYQVPITNPSPSHLHYFPFASCFPLPHFTKFAVLFALFFIHRFLVRSHVCLCCHVPSICLQLRLLKIY